MIKEQTARPALDLSGYSARVSRVDDTEFMTMGRVFGEHGGMVNAEELVQSMRTSWALRHPPT